QCCARPRGGCATARNRTNGAGPAARITSAGAIRDDVAPGLAVPAAGAALSGDIAGDVGNTAALACATAAGLLARACTSAAGLRTPAELLSGLAALPGFRPGAAPAGSGAIGEKRIIE